MRNSKKRGKPRVAADWLANLLWVTALHIFRHWGYLSDSGNLIRLKFCTISWASVHKSGPSIPGRKGGTQLYFEIKVEVLAFEILDEYFKNCQNWF